MDDVLMLSQLFKEGIYTSLEGSSQVLHGKTVMFHQYSAVHWRYICNCVPPVGHWARKHPIHIREALILPRDLKKDTRYTYHVW